MSRSLSTLQGSIHDTIKQAIVAQIHDAEVEVTGGGGHFTLRVRSKAFENKRTLERQRLVLRAIAHLMAGDNAPVHAVDSLTTEVPS